MLASNFANLSKRQKNSYIYRTTTFSRLVELFETNQNTLISPSRWDDPFENYILKAIFDREGENVQFSAHNRSFAQCWSLKYESDAMWRIYSPDKSAVRIRTKVEKLAKSLSAKCETPHISAYIGQVEYYSKKAMSSIAKKIFEDIEDGIETNFARTLLCKRKAFNHEKEVRLMYFGNHTDKGSETYKYEINPHELIDSVAIDPRAPDQLVDVYKYYLRNRIKFRGHIIKSRLYDPPEQLIYRLKP